MTFPLHFFDSVALVYFIALWIGYARYARLRARRGVQSSLSRTLRMHREAWVSRMLERDLRVGDASLLANQERVVGFFASTTLILVAAVLTALSNSQEIADLVSHIPFAVEQTSNQVEFKFQVLILVLVFAFFKVTWSLREYGFASVLMGSAPMPDEQIDDEQRRAIVKNLAKLMDRAGHDNNSAIRAYYFALSLVVWLLGTLPFMVSVTAIVLVLYDRECRSEAVTSMDAAYVEPDAGCRETDGL